MRPLLACLAGVVGFFRPDIWRPARPWARPAALWLSVTAALLLAGTAVFEFRRAGRLSPVEWEWKAEVLKREESAGLPEP